RQRPARVLEAAARRALAIGREALVGALHHRLVGGVDVAGFAHGAVLHPLNARWSAAGPPARRGPYLAPSFAAASRKFLTSAVGFARPPSFSPRRFTQMTGTFILSSGTTSVS